MSNDKARACAAEKFPPKYLPLSVIRENRKIVK